MKIAILSWGSLIRTGEARGLRIAADGWKKSGPILPIEFSRVSQSGDRHGCLTLVLDEQNGVNVPTQFAVSTISNLDLALTQLRFVENIKLVYSVGYVNLIRNTERGWARQNTPNSCDIIKEWAHQRDFDAVIWTSLLPNFQKILGYPFTTYGAVNYVNTLPEPIKVKALEYINMSPVEVITPVRTILSPLSTAAQAAPQAECVDEEGLNGSLMRFINKFRRPHYS